MMPFVHAVADLAAGGFVSSGSNLMSALQEVAADLVAPAPGSVGSTFDAFGGRPEPAGVSDCDAQPDMPTAATNPIKAVTLATAKTLLFIMVSSVFRSCLSAPGILRCRATARRLG